MYIILPTIPLHLLKLILIVQMFFFRGFVFTSVVFDIGTKQFVEVDYSIKLPMRTFANLMEADNESDHIDGMERRKTAQNEMVVKNTYNICI